MENVKKVVGGIKSIYKKNGKVSLSEKEIEEICNSSLSGVLNNNVEDLGEEVFNNLFLNNFSIIYGKILDKNFLDLLYGKDKRQKYACSVYAGQSRLVNDFEAYLAGKRGGKKIPEESIRRIGLLGFWHYFVECKPKRLALLKSYISLFKTERVIDIIEQNRSPFCSIASSLRQIK